MVQRLSDLELMVVDFRVVISSSGRDCVQLRVCAHAHCVCIQMRTVRSAPESTMIVLF